MSIYAITLDEKYFRIAEEKARALGQTPEQYLQALIDADSRSFDDILQPVREGFNNVSDGEMEDLFGRARDAARQKSA